MIGRSFAINSPLTGGSFGPRPSSPHTAGNRNTSGFMTESTPEHNTPPPNLPLSLSCTDRQSDGSSGSDVTPRCAILDEPEGRKPGPPAAERNRHVDEDSHDIFPFTGLNPRGHKQRSFMCQVLSASHWEAHPNKAT